MKGLLIKDIKLMKLQRSVIIIMIIIAVTTALSMDNISFIVGYLGSIVPIFAVSTISYDEFDNGNKFLFSLPVSRKGYVIEKYCFGMLMEAVAIALAAVLSFIVGAVKGNRDFPEVLVSMLFVFAVMTVLIAVLIPVQLKFGAEKSKFVIFAIVGATATLGYGGVKLLNILGVDLNMIVNDLSNLNIGIVIAVTVALALCIACLSMKLSTAVLCKKEF